MAAVSSASAHWEGSLAEGSGTAVLESSGLGSFDVSWKARTEGTTGTGLTSPEELVAAAHASCFSMALSGSLARAGVPPTSLDTRAEVTFSQVEGGWGITAIALSVRGVVPGISAETFSEHAVGAKDGCPVSKALAAVPEITVVSELLSG
jgi:osmotically inducible protein OsmC